MSNVSARAASARENARQNDGKLGSYHLEDAGTDADLDMSFLDVEQPGGGFGEPHTSQETDESPVKENHDMTNDKPRVSPADKLRAIGIYNPHNAVTAALKADPTLPPVYVSTFTRHSIIPERAAVVGVGVQTDPDAHWADNGSKAFLGGTKTERLQKAQEWASEKYGIEEWGKIPGLGGAVLPKQTVDVVKKLVKDSEPNSAPKKTMKVWSIVGGATSDITERLGEPSHRMQARYTVAAPSRAAAVRAFQASGLDVTASFMKNYGGETVNEDAVLTSNAKQGAVFASGLSGGPASYVELAKREEQPTVDHSTKVAALADLAELEQGQKVTVIEHGFVREMMVTEPLPDFSEVAPAKRADLNLKVSDGEHDVEISCRKLMNSNSQRLSIYTGSPQPREQSGE